MKIQRYPLEQLWGTVCIDSILYAPPTSHSPQHSTAALTPFLQKRFWPLVSGVPPPTGEERKRREGRREGAEALLPVGAGEGRRPKREQGGCGK